MLGRFVVEVCGVGVIWMGAVCMDGWMFGDLGMGMGMGWGVDTR